MNIYRVSGLFFRRFCFSRFSGKCAHSASNALTGFLAVLLLFSAFVLPVSAADLSPNDFTVLLYRETPNDSGGTTSTAYSFNTKSGYMGGESVIEYRPNDSSFFNTGATRLMSAFTPQNLVAGHDYTFSFGVGVSFGSPVVSVKMNGDTLFSQQYSGGGLRSISVNFTAPDGDSAVYLTVEISVASVQPASGDARFTLTQEMTLNDDTDNPGWLGKILQKFTDLGDRISGFFSNLGESIGNFFSSLGDRISGFFTDLWQNIKAKFDDLKQWFKDLGDRIQGFFVDLYNDIVDGLKKLFIPSDGYFESKKTELETFCTEHFGALYQAPTVLVDFIRKFTTISPQEPAITLPAIEFNFKGKHYQLTEAYTYSFSWVNDSSNMLYYLYKFYRGFITVVLFISFANYCKNKYYDVFKGGSSE